MHAVPLTLILLVVAAIAGCSSVETPPSRVGSSTIERAFEERARDVQVEGEGSVTRILSDDKQGSRHQRFIVRLSSGRTVLIQHNIDLAPRIEDLKVGDPVSFYGEYVWNEQGGLIHWTHHDPAGHHVAGWLRHKEQLYQ